MPGEFGPGPPPPEQHEPEQHRFSSVEFLEALAENAGRYGLNNYATELRAHAAEDDPELILVHEHDVHDYVMRALMNVHDILAPISGKPEPLGGHTGLVELERLRHDPQDYESRRQAIPIVYKLLGVAEQRAQAVPHLEHRTTRFDMESPLGVTVTEALDRRPGGRRRVVVTAHWRKPETPGRDS